MENKSEVIAAWIEQVDLAGPFQSANTIRALLASAPVGAPRWLIAALRSHLILLEFDETPLRWAALLVPDDFDRDDVVTAWLDFWRHVVIYRQKEFGAAYLQWLEKVRIYMADITAVDEIEVPHPFSSLSKDFELLSLKVDLKKFPNMADDILSISKEIESYSKPRGPKR